MRAAPLLPDAAFRLSLNTPAVTAQYCVGTPLFMAPELLRNESQPSKEADVYAFGILIFEGAPLLIGSSADSL